MIDAGIGQTHLNSVLTVMDIPSIGSKALKVHERKVDKVIEKVAEESCLESIRLETTLTMQEANEEEIIL